VNATELFRLRIQSLVARGLAAPEIAARVGLAAASEVWGGGEPRERPAWYLWLRDTPGAWQIELVEAGAVPSIAGAASVGRFTVRHYPASADPVFMRFSPEEREIAAEALDATGTPRIELASRIPDGLFTVASVEWALDLDGGAAVFALSSLDRLRTRTGRGDVVRDVPGWRLGAPISSLLAGLHAQVERVAASRVVVSRQPGFERVVSGGAADHRDAPDTVQGEALVLFPPHHALAGDALRLLEALHDPAAEIVADESFVTGDPSPHALAPDPRLPVTVSHAWFGGEEHVEGPMCACS
jgi:hypothetical protein